MDQQTPITPPAGQPTNGGRNKVMWIIILVIILALIGWFLTRKPSGNNMASQIKSGNNSAPAAQQSMSAAQSLKQLMASGISQKCDFSFTAKDNVQSQGTVYISGGKMHGIFDSTVNGKEMKTNMLNDQTNVYVWQDGQAAGFEMPASAPATTTPTAAPQQTVDPDAKYNYNCSPQSIDGSNFQLPAGVSFNDLNKMMVPPPGMPQTPPAATMQGSANSNALSCAACNNLTGNPKIECRAALACK